MSELSMEDRAHALENEYFRRREQELIEKMRTRLKTESSTEAVGNCPKCDGKLVETSYEDISVDVCNKCHGVWLDAGELAQITHHDESSWLKRLFA